MNMGSMQRLEEIGVLREGLTSPDVPAGRSSSWAVTQAIDGKDAGPHVIGNSQFLALQCA